MPLPTFPAWRRALCQAIASLLCAAACGATLAKGKAHEHGVAKLDVAVEAGRVSVALESPLDNLLGFERAPRTEAERKRVAEMSARLQDAGTLLRIDPAAQCTLQAVELTSAALALGTAASGAADAGHADLDASFTFVCRGGAPAFVDVGLFEAFTRLRRLEVQIAAPKGQAKRTLQRPNRRLELPR